MSYEIKKIAFQAIAQKLRRDRIEGMQKEHAERAWPEEVGAVREDPELAKAFGLEWLL